MGKFYDIRNEDCRKTMLGFLNNTIDLVLTSPFYNTNKKAGKNNTLSNTKQNGYSYIRYDTHVDNMTDEAYKDFTKKLFNEFNRIIVENGVVLYNLSYSNDNPANLFSLVDMICEETNWTIADVIVWKKSTALPNNCSPNRLTRIFEFVFVFCRKNETKTFYANKRVISLRKTGQKSYENIYNFIEAKNNDGSCPYNKATYSVDLCKQLLKIYAKENAVVYDPFIGTGTTAVACKEMGLNCIGSEISKNQCEWAENRLTNS